MGPIWTPISIHACYGLPTRSRPEAGLCLPSFDCFVASTPVGIATRPGRPLPGQDLHLLEQRNFHGTPGPGHRATSTQTEPLEIGISSGEYLCGKYRMSRYIAGLRPSGNGLRSTSNSAPLKLILVTNEHCMIPTIIVH